MTLIEALTTARQKIDRLDARLLLQHATGCSHSDLLARPETQLSAPACAQFAEWIERRAAGELVAPDGKIAVIIDRKGNLRWLHRGYKPGDENEYLNQIRALVRE